MQDIGGKEEDAALSVGDAILGRRGFLSNPLDTVNLLEISHYPEAGAPPATEPQTQSLSQTKRATRKFTGTRTRPGK
jgi:hypothetical protein